MSDLKLKTNVKCAACVAKITPYLNEVAGADSWNVDLTDSGRLLTVKGNAQAQDVVEALKKAGYKGEVQ
jgi:copper chaperone CopZ